MIFLYRWLLGAGPPGSATCQFYDLEKVACRRFPGASGNWQNLDWSLDQCCWTGLPSPWQQGPALPPAQACLQRPAPTGHLSGSPYKDRGGSRPKPRFTVREVRVSGAPQEKRGATHPQGFLGGQARPPTPTDGSRGGRKRGHLHSTFPPGNGCARCPLGKEERGTAGKPGGGGDTQAGSLSSV